MKKNEIYDKPHTEFYIDANYLVLADYWDLNAEKATIDFKSASYLKINEKKGIAEITVGNGPYYGLIELKMISDNKTLIRCYTWGYMESQFIEWIDLFKAYRIKPDANK